MSGNDIFIYKNNFITLADFIKTMTKIGAHDMMNRTQVRWGLSRKDVDIWIYYESNPQDFTEFKDDIARDYGFTPVNEIWIELGNDEGCPKLALDFCVEFAKVYSDIVVVDEIGNFYTADDLPKLEVDKKYHWAFKEA